MNSPTIPPDASLPPAGDTVVGQPVVEAAPLPFNLLPDVLAVEPIMPSADALLPAADTSTFEARPVADAGAAPSVETAAIGGLERHGFDPVLAHIARELPQIEAAFPSADRDSDDGRIFDVDEIVRQANEPWPEAESDEQARDVRPHAHLSPDRFDRGLREDAEAARKGRSARNQRENLDDSWGFDQRGFPRGTSGKRSDANEGIFGRPYDTRKAVPVHRLIKRSPSRKWSHSFSDRTRCRRCGSPRTGDFCESCKTQFCPSCNLVVEDGRCSNPQCDRWQPEPCAECDRWPCECADQ